MENIIREYATPLCVIGVGVIIMMLPSANPPRKINANTLQESALPSSGVALPITWGDVGAKLVETGVIDQEKLDVLYSDRGEFSGEYRKMLEKNMNEKIVVTNWNAGYILNLFWAFGLANENPILEDASEMMNPAYGGAGNFASTGGWTLAKGSAMDHYGKHGLVPLTSVEQALVDRVSRNIYRPCCGNATHFPDCNHGIAMLGLLELMARQGVSEQGMYKIALAVNSYWFPDTYITIATLMKNKGVDWGSMNPKEMLGVHYSSAQGYASIAAQVVTPNEGRKSGGCSVQ